MKLSPAEQKRRKEATIVRFVDSNGKPLNDACKSVTVQDKKDQCDINRIVSKLINKDGQIDISTVQAISPKQGRFGDFTSAVDAHESANRVTRLNSEFNALPAHVRAKFNNSPIELVVWLEDPKNKKEGIELGLIKRPKFEQRKVETPKGAFWVDYEDGVEVNRVPVTPEPVPTLPKPTVPPVG